MFEQHIYGKPTRMQNKRNAFITTEVKQNKKAASNCISQDKLLYGLLKNVAAFIVNRTYFNRPSTGTFKCRSLLNKYLKEFVLG